MKTRNDRYKYSQQTKQSKTDVLRSYHKHFESFYHSFLASVRLGERRDLLDFNRISSLKLNEKQ